MPMKDNSDELLTIQQLAELLQVPVATIYRWRHRGEGPRGIRVSGRHVRYRRADVEKFLEERADRPSWVEQAARARRQT